MADENYLSPVQQQAQAVDALTKAQFEADQGARREGAYNALARVYGQDTSDMIRGAPDAYKAASEGRLQNAQSTNMLSETASRDALLPGQVAQQPVTRGLQEAQTGEAKARTGQAEAQTQDYKAQADIRNQGIGDTHRALIASLVANSENPTDMLERLSPIASHLGISDDEVEGVRQAIKADPGHAKSIADALMRKAYPAQFATVGGVQYGQDKDGNSVAITHDKNGGVSIKPLDGVTPTTVQNANTGAERAATGDASLDERIRHDKATEGISAGRLKLASQNAAVLNDPDTVKYLAGKYRATNSLPAMGMGGQALRSAVFKQAAQDAAAEGKTGEADALNSQSFKARQMALDDLTKSTPNSMGGRIQSAGTLLDHMNTMDKLIEDLNNGDIRIKNDARQRFNAAFGRPAPISFDAQKTMIGDEMARVMIANGGAAKDRTELVDKPLARINAPAQLRDVMNLWRDDIGARMSNARDLVKGSGLEGEFDKRSGTALRGLLHTQTAAAPAPGPAVKPPPAKNDFSHLWGGR